MWAKKGQKAAFVGLEASKHVTMLPVVSADGKLLVMFFIIKGARLMKKFVDAWPEAVFIMTESGGIDNECWPSIIKTIADRAPRPCCILVDGHKVHCNNEKIILWAAEHEIHIVQGVPHVTHKTQPLDVGGFPTFNAAYDNIKAAAMADNKAVDPANSITWAKEAWDKISIDGAVPGIAKAFKKIGIHPYNPDAFGDEDFKAAALSGKIIGDAREAAGLPRSPEAIVSDAFGPPLPPSMVASAIARLSTKSTGSVLLTSAEHLSKMATDLLEKDQAAAEAAAAKEAKKAQSLKNKEEKDAKAAERLKIKAEKAASSAGASTGKKRTRKDMTAPTDKKVKNQGAAPMADAVEQEEALVEERPGKRKRFIKKH